VGKGVVGHGRSPDTGERDAFIFESSSRLIFSFEHDLFG
jgi:hypothetical protein